MSSLDARRGTVRYTPKPRFTGRDKLEFRVPLKGGRKLAATIVLRVLAARPTPAPAPQPLPSPAPDEGLPPAPPSIAFAQRNSQPAAQDTCPRSLHERYSVIAPDGKVYPAWHPAAVIDPATGRQCTFGHEHGRDPRGSDIYDWVAEHFAAPGKERYAGIPFGQATEALEDYPGAVKRQEDHVGYKIEYANDVQLTNAQGALGVTCDYLVRVHQGSHSPDALSNNVHELVRGALHGRDRDHQQRRRPLRRAGRLHALVRSGDHDRHHRQRLPGQPLRSADPRPRRTWSPRSSSRPAARPPVWATYELWNATTTLSTTNRTLASFDTGFGVFNPSRYANGSGTRRTIDLCGEVEANGDRANTAWCDSGAIAFDDARSAFDGTSRDTYLGGTTVENAGGPKLWWTDPYGGHARTTPFPGGICQLVGTAVTPDRADVHDAGVRPQPLLPRAGRARSQRERARRRKRSAADDDVESTLAQGTFGSLQELLEREHLEHVAAAAHR